MINPLPKRFTKRSSDSPPHIIVRKHITHNLDHSDADTGSFCGVRPQADTPRPRLRSRFRRAVLAPVHVETAVFVDSDMYHLMSNNFPIDTEREIVRFVLAMVNAVSTVIFFKLILFENLRLLKRVKYTIVYVPFVVLITAHHSDLCNNGKRYRKIYVSKKLLR